MENNLTPTLLLLYGNNTFGQVVGEYLQKLGFNTVIGNDHLTAEHRRGIADRQFELCLMHLTPENDRSIELIHEIREIRDIPVFVCAPEPDNFNKQEVMAYYEAGADDVIVHTLSTEVLAMKIKALLRRSIVKKEKRRYYEVGSFTFDVELQTLTRNGSVQNRLSGKESELLEALVSRQNQLVERGYILRTIWGIDNYFNGRSLSVYVNHLRHLLADDPAIRIISIHGKGYKICIDDEVINISFREDI